MALTILDGIVIVVVLISAILAMARGFVREVLSLASWVIAAAAAYFLYQSLLPLIAPYIENETVAAIVSAAVIFFVVLIAASYVTMKISDIFIDGRVGLVDRLLGFLFGAARGILILVIAYLFLDYLLPESPPWVAQAQTRPLLDDLSARLIAALPDDMEANLRDRLRSDPGVPSPAPVPPGAIPATPPAVIPTNAPADPGAGYGAGERGGLNQLIDNAGPAR